MNKCETVKDDYFNCLGEKMGKQSRERERERERERGQWPDNTPVPKAF